MLQKNPRLESRKPAFNSFSSLLCFLRVGRGHSPRKTQGQLKVSFRYRIYMASILLKICRPSIIQAFSGYGASSFNLVLYKLSALSPLLPTSSEYIAFCTGNIFLHVKVSPSSLVYQENKGTPKLMMQNGHQNKSAQISLTKLTIFFNQFPLNLIQHRSSPLGKFSLFSRKAFSLHSYEIN